MKPFFYVTASLAAAVWGSGTVAAAAQGKLLFSFEGKKELTDFEEHATVVRRVHDHATDGEWALEIRFQVSDWPNVFFRAPSFWDWRAYGMLTMDLYNPEQESLQVLVRIDDSDKADGNVHCRTGGIGIPPRTKIRIGLPLGEHDLGMRAGPPVQGVRMMGARGVKLDSAHIVAFQLFLAMPKKEHCLFVDNIRLGRQAELRGIVDRFGQYSGADWPGKIRDESELRAAWKAEEPLSAQASFPKSWDKYGGWAAGPQLKATRAFRTKKLGKQWWLVTPEGHLFFSVGVDVIARWSGKTLVEGREAMFLWLPKQNDPLAAAFGKINGKRSYNFYAANLIRKFGPNYSQPWAREAVRRLQRWRFNTVGNWSDRIVFQQHRTPYTVSLGVWAKAHISVGNQRVPDPFAPDFEATVRRTLSGAESYADDPWCIGFFVNNEMPWGGWGADRYRLISTIFGRKKPSATKRAFVAALQKKYAAVGELNRAWACSLNSWSALLDAPVHPDTRRPAVRKDFSEMLTAFAEKYFSAVAKTLHEYAPARLYLGCRFSSRPMEVVRVAAKYSDVVSFNIYSRFLDDKTWRFTDELGAPCLVGEFHFGALDRGLFHCGLVPVNSQKDRANSYVRYVRSVLRRNAFVGCHWFQYVDEALTGRFDGENYNIGMVTACDIPYPELTAAATKINEKIYEIRARAKE